MQHCTCDGTLVGAGHLLALPLLAQPCVLRLAPMASSFSFVGAGQLNPEGGAVHTPSYTPVQFAMGKYVGSIPSWQYSKLAKFQVNRVGSIPRQYSKLASTPSWPVLQVGSIPS